MLGLKNLPPRTIGWLIGCLLILGPWSLSNVAFSFSARVLNVSSAYFAGSSFIAAAIALGLLAGRGPLTKETLGSPATWIYGGVNLANYVVTMNILTHITATQASMTQRLSIVVGLILSWLLLAQRPTSYQVVGSVLVALSVMLVFADIGSDTLGSIAPWIALSAILQAIRIFSAEQHKPYTLAMSSVFALRDQLRVVSVVMAVLGISFMSLLLLARMTFGFLMPDNMVSILPVDSSIVPSIISGLALGVLFVAPNRFFEFFVIARISSNSFLALASLTPAVTLVWELIFTSATDVRLSDNPTSGLLLALLLSAIGGLVSTGFWKSGNQGI